MSPTPLVISTLEYPGRLIALGGGAEPGTTMVVYAITGRSPSSQARRLVARDEGIWVEPTDENVLRTGNVELLVYPALLFHARGGAVSNGRQTGDIRERLSEGTNCASVLAAALEKWDFEPDAPIFTPRISGCVAAGKAALSVIRRGPAGETLRSYFDFPVVPGVFRVVSTYRGPNSDPLPVFAGEPFEAVIPAASPRETAVAVYDALAPSNAGRDFRVAVAAALLPTEGSEGRSLHVVNRHERT